MKSKKEPNADVDKMSANDDALPEQATRRITIKFRGGEYPGVASGDEFLGLHCKQPRGAGHPEWAAAVAKAMER